MTSSSVFRWRKKRELLQENIWGRRGVKLIFTGSHNSLTVAFKGSDVILGLYKCNYSLTRGKELALLPGRNKLLGPIKQGGGPCVCHLWRRETETQLFFRNGC